MITTTSAITGHLAMSQTVTAVSPAPTRSPTSRRAGPVTTTASAQSASSRIITTVIPIWIGRSFQNGRPSSTS